MLERGSGLLLHISSLPSSYGIGDLGPAAYQFINFLHEAKQSYWQVLPFNPIDPVCGNSPYSSNSAFAANTLFISPDILVEKGWLEKNDLKTKVKFSVKKADYAKAGTYKNNILRIAYDRFKEKAKDCRDFQKFCQDNAYWLDDYVSFIILKEKFEGKIWHQWPDEYRHRNEEALSRLPEEEAEKSESYKFFQFLFYQQWQDLKAYSNSKNVLLIGDIPIYVTDDSVDVWGHPQLFKLDDDSKPIYVAGVPPDYFSQTGQRWGNPVYDWDKNRETQYNWWMQRMVHNLSLFDIIRIDHFRGLVAYWQVPEHEKTAVNGEWVPGPGDHFFNAIKTKFPHLPIIAEDLGMITPDVTEAMERWGFPGMKVLLFAFCGDFHEHPYNPKNYTENFAAYTGTHDNNTILGWLNCDASDEEKRNLENLIGNNVKKSDVPWKLIQSIMASSAALTMIPAQDILGLSEKARMNTPGTAQDNWGWRLELESLTPHISQKLSQMTERWNRAAK